VPSEFSIDGSADAFNGLREQRVSTREGDAMGQQSWILYKLSDERIINASLLRSLLSSKPLSLLPFLLLSLSFFFLPPNLSSAEEDSLW
jgi:hypothetical protein